MDPLIEVVKQLGSGIEVVRDEQQTMKQRDVVTTNRAHPPSTPGLVQFMERHMLTS